MVTDAASERAAAMRLVGAGDVSGALDMLRRLAEASDNPEDRLMLGRVAYAATDFGESQAQLERAYRDFQTRGMPRRAAMAATALGALHFDGLEDPVVGRGWLTRAARMLEYEEPCVEKGYAVIGQVVCGMLSACDRCGDVIRAESSLRVTQNPTPNQHESPFAPLVAHCC